MRKLPLEARKRSILMRLAGNQAQVDFILKYTNPDNRLSALLALAEREAGGTMQEIAARKAAQDAFYAEYRRLTVGLIQQNEIALTVGLPMMINADSIAVEEFIVNHWRKEVTDDNYQDVWYSFKQWFRENYPGEYATEETVRFNPQRIPV